MIAYFCALQQESARERENESGATVSLGVAIGNKLCSKRHTTVKVPVGREEGEPEVHGVTRLSTPWGPGSIVLLYVMSPLRMRRVDCHSMQRSNGMRQRQRECD